MYVEALYLKASIPKLGAMWRIPIAKVSISDVPINFRIRELLSTGYLALILHFRTGNLLYNRMLDVPFIEIKC